MEPLTPAVFDILLALGDGERHGYAIMREVLQSSGRPMGPGTLYGSLKRMLEAGLIEECGEREDSELNEERRRYYRLTAQGRLAAVGEAERLEGLVRTARSKALIGTGLSALHATGSGSLLHAPSYHYGEAPR
ncbi:MAG TPA: PadR family transcriptional regulator [Acidisarcina sp.]